MNKRCAMSIVIPVEIRFNPTAEHQRNPLLKAKVLGQSSTKSSSPLFYGEHKLPYLLAAPECGMIQILNFGEALRQKSREKL